MVPEAPHVNLDGLRSSSPRIRQLLSKVDESAPDRHLIGHWHHSGILNAFC